MFQIVLTPAAGKRLIGRALVRHPAVQSAVRSGTIVIIAGTTNGYVAEELLQSLGITEPFPRNRFFRGITVPPTEATTESGRLPDESRFPGDVVLQKGVWLKGKTLFDVLDELTQGDVIVKGANAVDLSRRRAAVLIGHPKGGTTVAALQAVVGRRVQLLVPVGVEKRVSEDVSVIAAHLNAPEAAGARMMTLPGEVVTELDAIALLTGARAELVAAGGVCGAEGAVWLAVSGTREQEAAAQALLEFVSREPPFALD